MSLNSLGKVKIVVVGDSGVGKTSFVHLVCQGKVLNRALWTIGCSVDVRIHEFKEGTPSQRSYFVELWDVGGNNSHKNARHVFYNPVHGIVLVHDLTNRKSQQNLRRWLTEVSFREGDGNKLSKPLIEDFDAEQLGGFSQIPVLVVGTRQDQIGEYHISSRRKASSITDECSAEEIIVNCLDTRSLAPGSSNAVKLSRFFDKVIERQQAFARGDGGGGGLTYMEREGSSYRRSKSVTHVGTP